MWPGKVKLSLWPWRCMGSGCIDPHFLDLGTIWRWVVNFTPRPLYLPPGERSPSTHWMGGWVDLRDDLDDLETRKFLAIPGLELQPLGHPARSQSLYRLCYPGCDLRHLISYLITEPATTRYLMKNLNISGQLQIGYVNCSVKWHIEVWLIVDVKLKRNRSILDIIPEFAWRHWGQPQGPWPGFEPP
jgi:hypothetical protein